MSDFSIPELIPSKQEWLDAVLADFDSFLKDHADCERASIQIVGLLKLSKSTTNMYSKPFTPFSIDNAAAATITNRTNKLGINTLLAFSRPDLIPFETTKTPPRP